MSEIFSGITPLQRALDYHLERHNVISSNVANIDTPGFRPLELVRETVEGSSSSLPMTASNEAHLGGSHLQDYEKRISETEQTTPGGVDGNTVSLEREMSKMAANDLRYDGAVKLVTRKLASLRYAANDGTGS